MFVLSPVAKEAFCRALGYGHLLLLENHSAEHYAMFVLSSVAFCPLSDF